MSSSSFSNSNQPTWVPYVPTKDCSQGFCSIYCPQWCYFLFPPPPPFSPSTINNDSSSSQVFSPLVIAIIGILASAFLLITYYTIVSKYCTPIDQLNRRRIRNGGSSSESQTVNGGSDHPTVWNTLPSDGLDESVISKIAVWKYKKGGEGDLEVTHSDCSVCLSEFREGEDLRLLPKCTHAFHLQCIDTWLKSHSSCPLCRASILPTQHEELKDTHQTVININDHTENITDTYVNTDISNNGNEEEIIEVRDDEQEMDSNRASGARVSIADVLQLSMEEELMLAKEHGLLVTSAGSSRGTEKGSRALHSVMSGPVPMKRSLSSGRILRGRGRERDSDLPICDNSNYSNSNR